MELFSLHCPTCQARIRVRHLSAVGRVLHCPKCRSFVEIVAPPGWQPPAEMLADTHVGTEEELRYSETPDHLTPPARAAEIPPPDKHVAQPADQAPVQPPPAKRVLTRSAIPAAVLLLVIATAGWWLAGRDAQPLPPGAQATRPTAERNAPAEPLTRDAPPIAPAPANPAPEPQPPALDEPTPQAPHLASPTPDQKPAQETAATDTNTPPSDPSTPPSDPNTTTEAQGENIPAIPQDENSSAESRDDAAPPDSPPPQLELRPVDAAAGLARPLLGFESRGMPLYRWLAVVEQLAGCPVSLDLAALIALQVPADQPLTTATQAGTVQELLDATLSKLGLQARAIDEGIWITAPQQADSADEAPTARYDLGELVTAESTGGVDAVADALGPLFATDQAEGMRWSVDGPTLLVTARASALAPVEAALAHWRTVRHAATNSPDRPATTAWSLCADVLRRPVTVNFPEETPLTQVASYLSEVAQLPLVINARELRRAGLPHDLPVTASADGEPLAFVLAHLLDTWRLALLPSAARALEITTLADAQSRREVEFFDVRAGAGQPTGPALAERLELARADFATRGLAIHLDPLSGYLLARGPAEALLWLEAQLAAWRAEPASAAPR